MSPIENSVQSVIEEHQLILTTTLSSISSQIEESVAKLEAEWLLYEKRFQLRIKDPSASAGWLADLHHSHNYRQNKFHSDRQLLDAEFAKNIERHEESQKALGKITLHWNIVSEQIQRHESTLSLKRHQLEFKDEYGFIEKSRWIVEIRRFLKLNAAISGAIGNLTEISAKTNCHFDWVTFSINAIDQYIPPLALIDPIPLNNDGHLFERDCADTLTSLGWDTFLTARSGDQGVDILAKKNGITIAIQCKNHKSPVGNEAVQQVFSGGSFYGSDFPIVIANSGYTVSARQLAQKIGVITLDFSQLNLLESEILKRSN